MFQDRILVLGLRALNPKPHLGSGALDLEVRMSISVFGAVSSCWHLYGPSQVKAKQ